VRRNVWQRDEGRCTYLDARGQRCREQSGLEFHHQHPHARNGPANVENITLRCRSHNTLAAEQDFGRDVIRRKRRAARAKSIRAGAAPRAYSP
jgi:5-methylcytosine-specific restriction endonuclease McrA